MRDAWLWLWDGVLALTARALSALGDAMAHHRRMPPGHPERLGPCDDDLAFNTIIRNNHFHDVRSTPHHG